MSLTLDSPVSEFIAYVNQKNLYNSFNKMLIHCDDALKELLGVDSFAFFGLERILKEQKEKQMEAPKEETILADDSMSLEEVAAQILAKLHELPIDLSGTIIEKENMNDTSSETPSTPEYEFEEEEKEEEKDTIENYDEFHVSDKNMETVRFSRFEKNGVPIVKLNGYEFEEEDFLSYIQSLTGTSSLNVKGDPLNEGIAIGILASFLGVAFFSLWLSIINFGLSKMG
jgi:hypothetical protein